MQDGFVKIAIASPRARVADCAWNATQIVETIREAARASARLLVLPELCVTGSTCGDLFLQEQLLDDAMAALKSICAATRATNMLVCVGLPLRHHGKLYSCAAVLHHGHVLGIVPKSYPPGYGASAEARHFTPAFRRLELFETGFLRGLPIGTSILFSCEQLPAFTLAVELCEDLWMPTPPSILHSIAGATVVANLAASNEMVGQAAWRRSLVQGQSGRLVCAYAYADANTGESTTDTVFAGQGLIAENGNLLAENLPFSGGTLAMADVDVSALVHDRQRITSYPDSGAERYHTVYFSMPLSETSLTQPVNPAPFVPENAEELATRCETILDIQAAGLAKRLEHTAVKTAVLGLSGGLDSALALLVTLRVFQGLGLPHSGIVAVSMPGFGTTARTKSNSQRLCAALNIEMRSIDITAATTAHFAGIDHKPDTHDVVFENAQARMRTLTLMDLANQCDGLVVGTGDLSELALGWATYGGDHMSMYGVNAGIPKTLLCHILAHEATARPELANVLRDILETPVSPELLPPKDGEISQQTEDIIGPYELHDFFLYHILRWGAPPKKVLRLAKIAFKGHYSDEIILSWLRVFYRRFFSQQFKRSCLPDGPAVGSVSLSPRAGWHMPSDTCVAGWLRQLEEF